MGMLQESLVSKSKPVTHMCLHGGFSEGSFTLSIVKMKYIEF
jgi:hypothetical protein